MMKGAGQVIAGRYRLVEVLGRGGMGAVWRAVDQGLDREVAIKQLSLPDYAEGEERLILYARMEREARAAARLKHPGIITIYDRVIERDGRPWIVMEAIDGGSLGDLMKAEGRLTPQRVAGLGVQKRAHRYGRKSDRGSARGAHGGGRRGNSRGRNGRSHQRKRHLSR